MRYCQNCGSQLNTTDRFCRNCGASIPLGQATINERIQIPTTEMPKQKKKRPAILYLLILMASILALVVLFFAFRGKQVFSRPFSEDTSAISKATSSVVKLNCYDKNGELYATGSGFIMFDQNTIVTNYHVIEGNVYKIVANREDGTSFEINIVVNYDSKRDIAILGTKANLNANALDWESRTMEKGETVVAIGSPLGFLNSVSTGVFSGYIQEGGQSFLQFTAAISPGSSGGPLFNNNGKVIGVTTAQFLDAQNLNLAVPIDDVITLWSGRSANKEKSISEFYELFIHPVSVKEAYNTYSRSKSSERIAIEGYVSFILSMGGTTCCGIVDNPSDILGYVVSTESGNELIKECFGQSLFKKAFLVDIGGLNNSSQIKPGVFLSISGVIEENDATVFSEFYSNAPKTAFVLRDCELESLD